MKMQSPKYRCYYFEQGEEITLYYCLPTSVLERMVKRGKLSNKILEDYPDGVDIEVEAEPTWSEEEMAEYGLRLPLPGEDLVEAAKLVLREHSKMTTGHLNATVLERIARALPRKGHRQDCRGVFNVAMTKGVDPLVVFQSLTMN